MVSKSINNLSSKLEGLSDASRVWIWQAARQLNDQEIIIAQRTLNEFIPQWTSHDRALQAIGIIEYERFLIVCLDQDISYAASGCSIDSLTHMVQGITNSIQIDLFDRNVCYFLEGGEIQSTKLDALSEMKSKGLVKDDTLVFDSLVNNKADLLNHWPRPLHSSWHSRFL